MALDASDAVLVPARQNDISNATVAMSKPQMVAFLQENGVSVTGSSQTLFDRCLFVSGYALNAQFKELPAIVFQKNSLVT